MAKIEKLLVLTVLLIGVLSLVGCNSGSPTVETTPTITATNTPTPTETQIPTPTATATPSPADLIAEADDLLIESDYLGAIELYERALDIDPDAEYAHAGIINAHLWPNLSSSTISGLELAQEAAESYPESAVIQTALARAYTARNLAQEALVPAELAVELDPNDAMAHTVLGIVYLMNNRFDEAKAALEQAISLDRDLSDTYSGLGRYFMSTADYSRARAAFEKAADIEPDNINWMLNLGWLALDWKDHPRAEEHFQSVIDLDPNLLWGYLGMAYLAMDQKDFTTAEEWIESAKEIDDAEPAVYNALGDLYFEQKEYGDALIAFRDSFDLDAENFKTLKSLGASYMMIEAYNQAGDYFREIEHLFPNDPAASTGLGWIKYYQDEDLDALKEFRNALKLNPYYEQAYMGIAMTQWFLDDNEEAYDALAKALQYSLAPSLIHDEAGFMYAFYDESDAAELEYRLAKELDPYNLVVYMDMASLLYNQDRVEDALQEIEEGLLINPEDFDLLTSEGMYNYYLGNNAKAQETFKHVLNEDPENNYANLFLGLTYRDQGKYNDAMRQIDKYLRLVTGTIPEEREINLTFLSLFLGLGYTVSEDEAIQMVEDTATYFLDRSPDVKIEVDDEQHRTMVMNYRLPGTTTSEEDAISLISLLQLLGSYYLPRIDPKVENGSEIHVFEGGRESVIVKTSFDLHEQHLDGLITTEELLSKAEFSTPDSYRPRPSISKISSDVEEIRNLAASEPVPSEAVDEAQVREELNEGIDEQVRADIQRDAAVLSLMGVISPDTDLEQLWVDMYSESIVGYYNAEENAFYYVEQDERTALDDLTIAHEYVHALQDQNFGLDDLDDNRNEDESLAFDALIEGDATLASYEYMFANVSAADRLEAVSSFSGVDIKEDQTPPFIKSLALFPYTAGLDFVTALWERSEDWEVVNGAYQDPPISTEQILHPELYFDGEEPIPVTLPDFDVDSLEGWDVVHEDVMGEFGLQLFLTEHAGPRAGFEAASGWGGDRYIVFHNAEEDTFAVVFATNWDNQGESDQFWGLFRSAMLHRKGYEEIVETLIGEPAYRCWQGELDTACGYQDEQDVIIVISPDKEVIENLIQLIKGAE